MTVVTRFVVVVLEFNGWEEEAECWRLFSWVTLGAGQATVDRDLSTQAETAS